MQGDDPGMAVDTEMEPVMPLILVCKQGHQWKVARESRDSVSVCPHCGQVGETICTIEATHAHFSKADVELEELEYPPFREAVSPDRSFRFKPTSLATTPIADLHFPGFEIESKLGEGGMGIVYCARELKLNRRVALKVLLSGRAALPTELERFQVEAESVAKLRHENIVQIYQVGEFEGAPFFAMELIDGPNLGAYTKAKPIGDRESAALVETLASTLHHAHQHGIVHRDIKPQNVLITKDGQPKIADFGLAKHLDRESGQTKSGSVIGTPDYMAPEQAAGKSSEAGPVTDVYALGGVLYYLITGRPPFQSETVVDTLRLVVESDPPSPRILNPSVNRDLQTICLKCLEKEPAKRYASAGELANDLARFQENRPIIARPIGPVQRMVRWCRRSPRVAALSFALLFVVLLGTTGVFMKWREAEQQREQAVINLAKARQTVNEFYVVISENELLDVEGMQPLRATLLQKALDYFHDFIKQDVGDPEMQSQLALTWFNVGLINITLGSDELALDAFRRAASIYEELVKQYPDNLTLQVSLADLHMEMGLLQLNGFGNTKSAMKSLSQAQQMRQALVKELPANTSIHIGHADDLISISAVYHTTGQIQNALESVTTAISILDECAARVAQGGGDPHASWSPQKLLASAHNQLGHLHRDQGDLDTAAQHYARAIETLQKLRSKLSSSNLGAYFVNLANIYDEINDARAEVHYQQALEIFRDQVNANPAVIRLQHRLAMVHMEFGVYQLRQSNFSKAEQLLIRAIEIGNAIVAQSPDRVDSRGLVARGYSHLGFVYLEMGELHQSEAATNKSIELSEQLVQDAGTVIELQDNLAGTYHSKGLFLYEYQDYELARDAFVRAISIRESIRKSNPDIIRNRKELINHYWGLAKCNENLGRLKLSAEGYSQIVEECKELIADDVATDYANQMLVSAFQGRADARTNLKRFDLAIEDWNECIQRNSHVPEGFFQACKIRTIGLSGDHRLALQGINELESETDGLTLLMRARALGTASLALAEETSLDETERNRQITGLAKRATSLLKTIADEELLDDLPEQLKVEACQQDFSELSRYEEFQEFMESQQMDNPIQIDDGPIHLRQ